MKRALVIKSSVFSHQGESSQMVAHTVSTLKQKWPDIEIIERDLAQNPIDHLSGETTAAFFADESVTLSESQQKALALSTELISELTSVDYLVLAVPMYNFGIPSTLKAWIDHIARAGLTFKYSENGPVGLVTNVKKVIVNAARGGQYLGTAKDSQTVFLRDVLSFLGMDEVSFVYAEALNMGQKETSVSAAHKEIETLVSDLS